VTVGSNEVHNELFGSVICKVDIVALILADEMKYVPLSKITKLILPMEVWFVVTVEKAKELAASNRAPSIKSSQPYEGAMRRYRNEVFVNPPSRAHPIRNWSGETALRYRYAAGPVVMLEFVA